MLFPLQVQVPGVHMPCWFVQWYVNNLGRRLPETLKATQKITAATQHVHSMGQKTQVPVGSNGAD